MSFGSKGRLASPHTRKSRNHKPTYMCGGRTDQRLWRPTVWIQAKGGSISSSKPSTRLVCSILFLQVEAALRDITASRTECTAVNIFFVYLFKNDLCVSNSQARETVLFFWKGCVLQSSLCSLGCIGFSEPRRLASLWEAVAGPACHGICEVKENKELIMLVSPLWARHCGHWLREFINWKSLIFQYVSDDELGKIRSFKDEQCLLHRLVDIFHVLACSSLSCPWGHLFLWEGDFQPAALLVSYLTWPAFSAKPRLGLALITHSFNRKCLHFQLSVGGWRADKLWMETHNRFLLHPPVALWSEKERASACLSAQRGGRMAPLWVFLGLLCFGSGTPSGLG